MRASRWIRALFGALLVSGVLTIAASPAGATTATVSTEAQLRTALADPTTTMVTLANSIDLVDCSPSGGDLDRTGALVLDGGGFTLRQTCAGERVLESTSGTLTLQHLTVTGGDQIATADPGSDQGGGVRATNDLVLDDTFVSSNALSGVDANGGGVYAGGTLSTTSSAIAHNTATASGATTAPAFGGGAYASSMELDGTTVDDNVLSATSNTGAASSLAKGGGAFAELSMHVTGSTLDRNQASAQGSTVSAQGGGLLTTDLTIESSSVTDNAIAATGDAVGGSVALGGGVRATGALMVDSTSVSQNTATGVGAFGGGVEADGAITLTSSHIDQNTATSTSGSYGAGVLGGAGQDVTITDSTVDDNTATMTSDEIFRGVDGGGVALVANHDSFAPAQPTAGTVHLVRASVSGNDVRATTAGQSQGGQALTIGAGIYAGTIVLDSSHVDANELQPTNPVSAVGWGGGVAALTTLTANDSTLDRNIIAPDSALGIADGGGAYVVGSLVFTDSSARENRVLVEGPSGNAGCGALLASDVTVSGSAVSHNIASAPTLAFAGGVCADVATIEASTIEANSVTSPTAESLGGGAVIGKGVIRDTTISNNTVTGTTSHGGAVTQAPINGTATRGSLAFVNSTVSENRATGPASSAGGIDIPDHIGSIALTGGAVSLVFSTIAGNSAPTGANVGATTNPVTSFASSISDPVGGGANCDGVTLDDQGFTRVTDSSCGTAAAADPQLGVLADNGGPTATLLPSATSPLLDRVPADACLALVTVDQRGITRPQGTACDIGAVERAVPPTPAPLPEPTPLPTPAADGPIAAPAVVAEPRFTG